MTQRQPSPTARLRRAGRAATCSERISAGPVLAATHWQSNADLIVDLVKLGHLRADDLVLDPTYGKGTWWKKWAPANLCHHDFAADGIDFRDMPYADDRFDVVAFDPPYVSVGGRTTSGIPEMHDRYGLTDAPTTPAGVQALINAGLAECARVTSDRILVKCQDYISSGKFFDGTFQTRNRAIELGLVLVDRLVHLTDPRPQPPRDRQVHARNNLSTMFVFRKP